MIYDSKNMRQGLLPNDPTEAYQCPKCNSLNVSMDVSSNIIKCNDCQETSDTKKRFDVVEHRDESIKKELQSAQEAAQRGDRVVFSNNPHTERR